MLSKSAHSFFNRGNQYHDGTNGLKKDGYLAALCMRRAAANGYPAAQYRLACYYYYGDGVEKNIQEAMKWYTLAAQKGFLSAQYNLGLCYYVELNFTEAVKWFTLAAEKGHSKSQYRLAICYHNGQGVDKNIKEAKKWCTLAAHNRYAAAQNWLGFWYQYGEKVEQNLEEALKWYTLAAWQGHSGAQLNIGLCYRHGDGVEKNLKEAVNWYTKAAEASPTVAHNNLGELYLTEGDYESAIYHFHMSCSHPNSIAFLSFMTEKGLGVGKNTERAASLLRETDSSFARLCLGLKCLLQTPVDVTTAQLHFSAAAAPSYDGYSEVVLWMEKLAAETNDKEIYLMLSLIFKFGLLNISKDRTKAKNYLQQAEIHKRNKDLIDFLTTGLET